MKQPDRVRLAHMLMAAEKCGALWSGREFRDLEDDETAALATARFFNVDLEEIWSIVTKDLPVLIGQLREIARAD